MDKAGAAGWASFFMCWFEGGSGGILRHTSSRAGREGYPAGRPLLGMSPGEGTPPQIPASARMKGFFDKTTPLGEGDKIVTNISKGLKPRLKQLSFLYFETLKVELIFNQPLQVKSLKDLIGCSDTDQTDG
ncbi:hypothetical protein THAOC_12892, partial [Thalassiosira oceanica]